MKMTGFFRVTLVLGIMFLPVVFLSSVHYSFYPPDSSQIKIAFKKSGKRIVECREEELIKELGKRYREGLKQGRGVKMQLLKMCPAERHPVEVKLTLNEELILEKKYVPAGIRRDMASYVFEQFVVKQGLYEISVEMKDGVAKEDSYLLNQTITLASGKIALISFDYQKDSLIISQ